MLFTRVSIFSFNPLEIGLMTMSKLGFARQPSIHGRVTDSQRCRSIPRAIINDPRFYVTDLFRPPPTFNSQASDPT